MSGQDSHATRLPILPIFGALTVAGCVLLFVAPLAMRSITLADEGYLLLQSFDLANGKVLYRDLDAFVAPGVWFLLAFVFKLAGPSVWVSRIPVIIAFLALAWVSFAIIARLATPRWGLACVAVMLVCSVWAFPAWTFSFYSPYSILFAMLGLERLLAWRESRGLLDLLLVGLWVGLSIAFKQNYGVFALAGVGLGLIAVRVESGERVGPAIGGALVDGLRLSISVVAVALPFVLYFAWHGALGDAFYSLVIHPFTFSGQHGIPYLGLGALFDPQIMEGSVELMTYGAQPIYRTGSPGGLIDDLRLIERLHVLLYWFPPLIFAAGVWLGTRPRVDAGLLAVIAVAALIFVGVFPRADFNHLINVYQPVVVAGTLVCFALSRRLAAAEGSKPEWLGRIAQGVGGALLVLYLAVAAWWYHGLITYLHAEVEGERGGVKVSSLEAAGLKFLIMNIDALSEPNQALLTIPDIAMLNFLTARPMPSAYYNLYQHHIEHDQGAAVAEGSEANRVQVAVARYNDFFSDRVGLRDYAPALTRYLRTHFRPVFTVGRDDYILFERRAEPVPDEQPRGILDECRFGERQNEVRDHLLFRSLYQYPGVGRAVTELTVPARCRVDVPPEGGELVMRLGYRHPLRILSPATLSMEVVAEVDGQQERLMRKTFVVDPKKPSVYRFPALPEYRVDLSPYAGRSIVLLLRTTRTGRVLMSPAEHRLFGSVWQDPRIIASSAQREGEGEPAR